MTNESRRERISRRGKCRLGHLVLAFTLASATGLSSSPVFAQDYAAAGQHFDAAQEAFAAGKYELAAKEYQAAFDITKESTLLQSIGESWQRAGNVQKALTAYKAYLKAAPQAPDRAAIEERIKGIEAAQAQPAQAPGQTSQAPGQTSQAPGQTSQAPGQTSQAPGQTSQAPGQTSQATGQTSQATGQTSQATGQTSQATGQTSQATGQTSQATGQTSQVTGQTSQATGQTSQATGQTSQATGQTSQATGQTSQATGQTSQATGQTSQATGQTSQAPAETSQAPAQASQAPAGPTITPPEPPPSKLRVAGWISVASAVALVTGGAVIGLGAQSRADEIRRRTTLVVGDQPLLYSESEREAYTTLMSEGRSYNTAAISLFAVGGVAAATAITLFVADFVRKPKTEPAKQALVVPSIGPGMVGLSVLGGM